MAGGGDDWNAPGRSARSALERHRLSGLTSFCPTSAISVGYKLIESTPKTHQSRVIDLDTDTLASLLVHRTQQLQEAVDWGDDYTVTDLVFKQENGEATHPDSVSQRFSVDARNAVCAAYASTTCVTHTPRSRSAQGCR